MKGNVCATRDGDLVRVHHGVHRRLAHGFPATAEDCQARQPRLESPRQARAVDVAGALTGDDHDLGNESWTLGHGVHDLRPKLCFDTKTENGATRRGPKLPAIALWRQDLQAGKNSAKVCEVKQSVRSPRCARSRNARLLEC
ncbi:MAG: hypothetical protein ABSA59_04965 [Terriglobia bacterium]|jgi:hypothetical protein